MLDVDQNYGEPDTPKPLPTFKDYVAQDVETVFFNLNEFAEERYIDDKQILKAKSLEIQVGGATVTISEGGEIKVTSPAGITLAASGELKMTASTINATAGTVNIQGGGGDVVVSGKSLVSHTHTGNLGKKTSAPL